MHRRPFRSNSSWTEWALWILQWTEELQQPLSQLAWVPTGSQDALWNELCTQILCVFICLLGLRQSHIGTGYHPYFKYSLQVFEINIWTKWKISHAIVKVISRKDEEGCVTLKSTPSKVPQKAWRKRRLRLCLCKPLPSLFTAFKIRIWWGSFLFFVFCFLSLNARLHIIKYFSNRIHTKRRINVFLVLQGPDHQPVFLLQVLLLLQRALTMKWAKI